MYNLSFREVYLLIVWFVVVVIMTSEIKFSTLNEWKNHRVTVYGNVDVDRGVNKLKKLNEFVVTWMQFHW